MIEVPIQVKDALREGRLRKNYRFEVLTEAEVPLIVEVKALQRTSQASTAACTVGATREYRLYSEEGNIGFTYYLTSPDENPLDEPHIVPPDPTKDYTEVYINIEKWWTISIDASAFPLHLQYLTTEKKTVAEFTINNDTLVSESVNLDERMSSGDDLKFGLCEGSSLEFQYFNHPSIFGRQIRAFVDVQLEEGDIDNWYSIPMGYFTVKTCSRQASTGIMKVTAYNKLQSTYLDSKINDELVAAYNRITASQYVTNITTDIVLSEVLQNYAINDNTDCPLQISNQYDYQTEMDYVTWRVGIWGAAHYIFIVDFDINMPSIIHNNVIEGYSQIKLSGLKSLKGKLPNVIIYDQLSEESHNVLDGKAYLEVMNSSLQRFQFIDFYNNELDEITLPYIENVRNASERGETSFFRLYIPSGVTTVYDVTPNPTIYEYNEALRNVLGYLSDVTITFYHKNNTEGLGQYPVTSAIQNWADVTLRELQSAIFESECEFGKLDRESDLFSGVELNNSRLLPADTLYPDNALYPEGAQESAFRSQYSKLWADEGNVRKWRYLIITYKGLDENQQEKDFTLQRTVNADGTDDYNCSDNWLFRNLIWTSTQIGEYADAMVAKMQDVTWFPFEMWCAGLPYLETGDEIEIPLGEDTYTSYILQRQLKGIQNLQDTYINGTLDIF